MKIWNGWGDKTVRFDLPPKAHDLLRKLIGEGKGIEDYPLGKFLTRVPATPLPHHPLISTNPKDRLDHSHGQSLPDWVALRGGILRRFTDGVALPGTVEEVQALLDFAREHQIVVIPYGGGTSVVGHLEVPQEDRPVLSLSLERLNHLITLDTYSMLGTFEGGVRGPELEAQLRARGFTLGHFPQSFEYSSLGGWVVTRSSGQESMYYGRIEQLFAGGEVLTPKGAMSLYPFPASAAGPDLRQLVLGSEGRLGILTKVTVRISPLPERDDIYGIFFPSWDSGIEAVRDLSCSRMPISMIRLSNPKETETSLAIAGHEGQVSLLKRYLRLRRISMNEACACLIGFIGSPYIVRGTKREAFSIISRHKGVTVGRAFGEVWKKYRFRAPYLRNSLWALGYAVDTLETSVTWDKVTSTMKAIEKALGNALAQWNERVQVFSHLSHVYPTGSSIYTTFVFRLADTPEETLMRWKTLKGYGSRAIVEAGGTISHQHGIGQDHKSYMQSEKGEVGMGILKQLCSHLDPDGRMNPQKLIP